MPDIRLCGLRLFLLELVRFNWLDVASKPTRLAPTLNATRTKSSALEFALVAREITQNFRDNFPERWNSVSHSTNVALMCK